MTAADVQAGFCATLVDEWARAGITDAVIAPGSRSTPMVLALAGDERIRVHVVLDERSAGFVALGLGLATGRPAPVVTTSGTAAVELHPSVLEAHHAGVPMLAVTADRPVELHHVGAPQTIEQEGLFGAAVRWAVSPGVPDADAAASWRSLAARAVAEAPPRGRGGPVHLNLAFREPLLGDPTGWLPAARAGRQPWHTVAEAEPLSVEGPLVDTLAASAGGRGVIVAGAGAGEPEAVLELGRTLCWPVLADPRSGCRVPDAVVVGAADALLRAKPAAGWRPDVVLHLGRPWASKVVGQWLADVGGDVLDVLVDPAGDWADPDRRARLITTADPTALAKAVVAALDPPRRSRPRSTPWLERWQVAEAAAQAAIDETLATEPGVSEAGLARALLRTLPDGSTLVASSSMPVRDVEWFGAPRLGVRVLANRGANGIDGIVSTTLGVALGVGGPEAGPGLGRPGPSGPAVGLLGDLAFFYDAGSLLWARDRPVECTLVVVDNDGGGIFSFLPQASSLPPGRFERFWGTPHGLDVCAVAAAYGVPAVTLNHLRDLRSTLAGSGRAGLQVIVVRTDRRANVAAHDRLNAAVAARVATL